MEIIESLQPGIAYSRLQSDFQEHLPAILVKAEQNDGDYLATHRVQLEYYHQDMNDCEDLARTIEAHLMNAPHQTSVGMIDSVRRETNLREIPYTEQVVMYTSSVFVDTRCI
ncbi:MULTISPECIES: hypothetical protein [Brevibacterium]|uniref:hypothetical protein n=1 Tax=Brevibacterium TaxID=1696 RepID=UPI0011BDF809|nr:MULTISPECIES: hypothetical protein [Brevibacterium]